MPVRITSDADVRRHARRRAAAQLTCTIAVLAFACDGSLCPPVTAPPSPTPVLQSRYVLASVNGAALPATIASASGVRVRLLADTLTFVGAGTPPVTSGTYVETRVLGTTQGNGAEEVSRVVSAPQPWTQSASYAALELTGFTGARLSTTTATMLLANATMPTGAVSIITSDNATHRFEPR